MTTRGPMCEATIEEEDFNTEVTEVGHGGPRREAMERGIGDGDWELGDREARALGIRH
jgi:hypothetical protein